MHDTSDAPLRIKPLSKVLARVDAASTAGQTVTARATLKNPSRRLSVCFSVAFEADDNSVPNTYPDSTWSARAVRRNRLTGKNPQAHALITAQVLPNMYELDSAIREILITAVLGVPLDGAAGVVSGNWVLLAEWEPNQPAMCEPEIKALFEIVDLSVNATERVIP